MINLHVSDNALKKKLRVIKAYEIADFFDDLDLDNQIRIIKLTEPYKSALVFSYMDHADALKLLKSLDLSDQKIILNNLESDDLKSFLDELDEDDRIIYSGYLSDEKDNQIELLKGYSGSKAGSIMMLDYLSVDYSFPIKKATSTIIKNIKEQHFIDLIFCVDDKDKLMGIVSLKDLIVARADNSLKEIMNEDYVYANIDEDIDEVIKKVRDYDILAIPVLDNDKILKGIITADDIILELSSAHEEDYARLAGISFYESDDKTIKRTFKRLPWLLLSVVIDVLLALFLSGFEGIMAAIIALTFFQPMILGMAGNIGTQSLAATILGLNAKELSASDKIRKHVLKETGIALINSLILGIISFLVVFGFLSIGLSENNVPAYLIGLTVGISIFSSLFISAVISALIPIFFEKIKVDPSAASGPIMTTINDVCALLIYFGSASIILAAYLL